MHENDLNFALFTIDITKETNFYFLAKFFNYDYFKFLNFPIYQTLIKAYINTPFKRNRNFHRFWKKKLGEKKIKANFIASRTTLWPQNIKFCMQKKFSKNVCLRTKFDLPLKKKQKKFWAKFSQLLEKFFVSPSKKCPSYNFHIWELYDKHFFQKTKTSVFLSPDCFIWIKQPQK